MCSQEYQVYIHEEKKWEYIQYIAVYITAKVRIGQERGLGSYCGLHFLFGDFFHSFWRYIGEKDEMKQHRIDWEETGGAIKYGTRLSSIPAVESRSFQVV